MLHDRRGADREIGAEFVDRREILFEAGAILHAAAPRDQPFPVGIGPDRARAGGADIGHVRAALDQQPRDQQFRAFIARHGDPPGYGPRRERTANGGQEAVLRRIDRVLRDAAGHADRIEPGGGALDADRGRADHAAPRRFEFAHAGGVKGVDRGDSGAIERRIELAPLARRDDRAGRKAQRFEQ
ncbi:hypothetical protein D9M73_136920 [compost metagenome]